MALFFQDTDDQLLNAGNWDVGGDKISFGCWLQPDDLNPKDVRFINYAAGLNDHIWMLSNILQDAWQPRMRVQANGQTTTLIGATEGSDFGWHHCVGTYDGSLASNHMKIYFDGLLNSEGSHGDPGDINTDAGGNRLVVIGANLNITTVRTPWLGRISEVFVYKHVLTPEEVWLLFKHRDPQTIHRDKLRGHWRCNSRGLIEPDLSGWRHHATKSGISNLPIAAPNPTHYQIWVPPFYPRSAGVVTLTPAAIVVSISIPATTVTKGPVTLAPSPITVAISVPSPTVTAGAVTLTPAPAIVSISVPAPTVTSGAVTLTPAAMTVAVSVPTPTVISGAVTLSPAALVVAVSISAPTIVATLTPAAMVVTVGVPTPTVTSGAVTFAPAAIVVSVGVPAPTITAGAVTLSPAAMTVAISVPTPTITVGAVTLSPTPMTVAVSVPTPTVTSGAVTLSPAALVVAVSISAPMIVSGASLTPAAVVVAVSVPTPTVTAGTASLTPTPLTVALSIPATAVVAGGVTLSPAAFTVAIGVVAPTVTIGTVTLSPTPLVVAINVPTATIDAAGVLTPSALVVAISIPSPTVVIGALTLSPTAVVVAISVPDPTVTAGAVLTPAAIVVTVSVPTPTVDEGAVVLLPSSLAVPVLVPTPALSAGGVSLTPSTMVVLISAPMPTLSTGLNLTPAAMTVVVNAIAPTVDVGAVVITPPPCIVGCVSVSPEAVSGTIVLLCTFSKAFDAWERLVASSPRVQDLLNELTPEMAKERIHWLQSIRLPDSELPDASPNPRASIHPRPYAVIDVSVDEYVLDSDNEFRGGGTVVLAIEAEIPTGVKIDRGTQTSAQLKTNWKERMAWMAESSECVLIQLTENSGKFDATESFLNVMDLSITQGPGEFGDDEENTFMGLVITGTWT